MRQTLRRCCQWLWRRSGRLRDLLLPSGANQARREANSQAEARARFWDGVRDGQREAAARCSEKNR